MEEFIDTKASLVTFIGEIDHTALLSRSVESFLVNEGRLFA